MTPVIGRLHFQMLILEFDLDHFFDCKQFKSLRIFCCHSYY